MTAPSRPPQIASADVEELVPAVLTFSFEEAKQHLIGVDPRFEDVFRRVKCKPYEHLERVDPFRCVIPPDVLNGTERRWQYSGTLHIVRLFHSV